MDSARLKIMDTIKERYDRAHIAPTDDEIAECAYWIWESEGHPIGRGEEHWRQAEMQLYLSCALKDALESEDKTE